MKAVEIKAAAMKMLDKYLVEGKTEYSTADYTASVYPMDKIIVVSYMKRENDEWPTQRSFKITLIKE